VQIPYQEGQLISLFHEQGHIDQIEHNRRGEYIRGAIPGRLMARYAPFVANQEPEDYQVNAEED
jgi:GTP-binding protein HflX